MFPAINNRDRNGSMFSFRAINGAYVKAFQVFADLIAELIIDVKVNGQSLFPE